MTEPWRPGDPIGGGIVYLPDSTTKQAYAEECQRQIIDAAARQVVRQSSLHARRQMIESYPKRMQQRLKDLVLELWRTSSNDAA